MLVVKLLHALPVHTAICLELSFSCFVVSCVVASEYTSFSLGSRQACRANAPHFLWAWEEWRNENAEHDLLYIREMGMALPSVCVRISPSLSEHLYILCLSDSDHSIVHAPFRY